MNKRKTMAVVVAVGGILASCAGAARAAADPPAAAIERPRTAADHRAIAERYATEAIELREQAEMHKLMLRAYEEGPEYHKVRRKTQTGAMTKHCRNLIEKYTAAAEGAEAMAAAHRNLAAETQPAE